MPQPSGIATSCCGCYPPVGRSKPPNLRGSNRPIPGRREHAAAAVTPTNGLSAPTAHKNDIDCARPQCPLRAPAQHPRASISPTARERPQVQSWPAHPPVPQNEDYVSERLPKELSVETLAGQILDSPFCLSHFPPPARSRSRKSSTPSLVSVQRGFDEMSVCDSHSCSSNSIPHSKRRQKERESQTDIVLAREFFPFLKLPTAVAALLFRPVNCPF
jgi:hypothetical protein